MRSNCCSDVDLQETNSEKLDRAFAFMSEMQVRADRFTCITISCRALAFSRLWQLTKLSRMCALRYVLSTLLNLTQHAAA